MGKGERNSALNRQVAVFLGIGRRGDHERGQHSINFLEIDMKTGS